MGETKCPCCGQTVDAIDPRKLAAIVSPVMAEMVAVLLKNPGQYVPTEEIARFVWRRDPNGGPANAAVSICNLIAFNKTRLAALGWAVKGRLGRYGGYMLTTLDEATP